MKYLLIDGNNLAIRSAFANAELRNADGVSTSVHYGVFQSLINLKTKYPDYQVLIVWDGKSKRRKEEAQAGIDQGLIRSGYKANRVKDEQPQPLLDFYEQAPFLKKGIEQAGIPQMRLLDFEADDLIASFCKKLRDENEIVVVTSDKDYYQILHDNVIIFDGMKLKEINRKDWEEKYGIKPPQHIDCGALGGDTGDNIFGVPGWGEKTSLKAIQKHQTWENVLKSLHVKFDSLREEYPDVTGDEFKELESIETKSGKQKYPEIKEDFSFTGVALAFENKKWKPKADMKSGLKNNLLALMFEDRVKLAYSLKKMDDEIADLPEIKSTEFNEEKVVEYFNYYNIESLMDSIDLLK